MVLLRLAPRARKTLRHMARTGRRGREVRRAQLLLWLDRRETVRQVAARVHLSRQAIYAIVRRYLSRRALPVRQRIADAPHRGRPATKRLRVRRVLQELLAVSPSHYRYRSPIWTVPMLRCQAEKRLKCQISARTVRRALHGLGNSYKRPRYVYARRPVYWRQAKGGSKQA